MELVSNANAGQEKTFLYKVGKKEENIANIQIAFAKKTVTPRNHNEWIPMLLLLNDAEKNFGNVG